MELQVVTPLLLLVYPHVFLRKMNELAPFELVSFYIYSDRRRSNNLVKRHLLFLI